MILKKGIFSCFAMNFNALEKFNVLSILLINYIKRIKPWITGAMHDVLSMLSNMLKLVWINFGCVYCFIVCMNHSVIF